MESSAPTGGQSNLYDGYAQRKGWTAPHAYVDSDFYDQLWRTAGLADNRRVLEIGFGSGSFLDWALRRGHEAIGVDILPDMLAATAARGHDVRPGPLTASTFASERFDLVCAFDVFEHLTVAEIHQYIAICLKLIDGPPIFLIRFPNGTSPLSVCYQNSDITHKTILSLGIINQIASEHGLVAKRINFRPYPQSLAGRIRRAAVYGARRIICLAIGFAYFGRSINLDPNIEILLTAPE